MPDSVRELAFELSRSALIEQEKRLSDLRSRGGTLLAAASIAGSFLATKQGDLDTTAVLAILAYVAAVGTAVYVLLPHKLVFEFRGSVITELEQEIGGGLQAAYTAVTEWFESFQDQNSLRLESLTRWYTASCVAVAVEVVLWTLSVTGTL